MKKIIVFLMFIFSFNLFSMEKSKEQSISPMAMQIDEQESEQSSLLLMLPLEIIVKILQLVVSPTVEDFKNVEILDAITKIVQSNLHYSPTCRKFRELIDDELSVYQSKLYKQFLPQMYAPEYLNFSQNEKNEQLRKVIADIFRDILELVRNLYIQKITYNVSKENKVALAKLVISGAVAEIGCDLNDIYARLRVSPGRYETRLGSDWDYLHLLRYYFIYYNIKRTYKYSKGHQPICIF